MTKKNPEIMYEKGYRAGYKAGLNKVKHKYRGRPHGALNKKYMLDEHRSEIIRLLNKKISKAAIAKLIDCKAQTLYVYLKRFPISIG